MRQVLFAVLVAALASLVTWVIARGTMECPTSAVRCPPAGATASSTTTADPDAALEALLLGSLGGAKATGDVELYPGDKLFEYINGAAPVYIERKFRNLAAAQMQVGEGGELTVDVYDMSTPDGASSIYAKEDSSSAKPIDLGAQARTAPMALVFRKGRYYVKLTAFDETAEAALADVARALAGRIP